MSWIGSHVGKGGKARWYVVFAVYASKHGLWTFCGVNVCSGRVVGFAFTLIRVLPMCYCILMRVSTLDAHLEPLQPQENCSKGPYCQGWHHFLCQEEAPPVYFSPGQHLSW